MQLTNEQLKQFREEGYLAIPDFWDEREVGAMQAELERLKEQGLLRNVVPGEKAAGKINLQLCPMSPHSALFRAMPFAPKVREMVARLIGDPVLLHLDQVFLKPAKHGAGTNWHQDNAYFHIDDPQKGTALWTAVHRATRENGTMRIIPGSFCERYEHSRDPDSDHHIRCYPPEERARFIELPAGGALFFAYGTAHATGANHTDHERAGVALHFINGEVGSQAVGGFEPGIRPVLTGPDASGGEKEYGVRVEGTWEDEVERANKSTFARG